MICVLEVGSVDRERAEIVAEFLIALRYYKLSEEISGV